MEDKKKFNCTLICRVYNFEWKYCIRELRSGIFLSIYRSISCGRDEWLPQSHDMQPHAFSIGQAHAFERYKNRRRKSKTVKILWISNIWPSAWAKFNLSFCASGWRVGRNNDVARCQHISDRVTHIAVDANQNFICDTLRHLQRVCFSSFVVFFSASVRTSSEHGRLRYWRKLYWNVCATRHERQRNY